MVVFCVSCVSGTADTPVSSHGAIHVSSFGIYVPIKNFVFALLRCTEQGLHVFPYAKGNPTFRSSLYHHNIQRERGHSMVQLVRGSLIESLDRGSNPWLGPHMSSQKPTWPRTQGTRVYVVKDPSWVGPRRLESLVRGSNP